MQKLNLQRSDLYTIEVNDKGDTIAFSLEDVDLPFKLQRAFDGAKKAEAWLKGQIAIIKKKEDHKKAGALLSDNEQKTAEVRKKAFKMMRDAMDEFLGEGGCDKIFGKTSYLSMFDDLFAALDEKGEDGKSHLERMKIGAEGVRDRIQKKYGNDNDAADGDVLR